MMPILPAARDNPGPAAVFIDELDTGVFQRAANCQIVSRTGALIVR
jgi:hypothetical protein